MAKKATDKDITEIKKLLNNPEMIVGTDETIKHLKKGNISRIFLCSNCSKQARADIEHYSRLSNTEIINLKQANDELGVVCKKPFSISVISIKKGAA